MGYKGPSQENKRHTRKYGQICALIKTKQRKTTDEKLLFCLFHKVNQYVEHKIYKSNKTKTQYGKSEVQVVQRRETHVARAARPQGDQPSAGEIMLDSAA